MRDQNLVRLLTPDYSHERESFCNTGNSRNGERLYGLAKHGTRLDYLTDKHFLKKLYICTKQTIDWCKSADTILNSFIGRESVSSQ